MLGNGLFSSKTPQSTQKEVFKKKRNPRQGNWQKTILNLWSQQIFWTKKKNVKIFLKSIWIPQNYKEHGRTFFFFLGTPVVKGRTILCNNDQTLKVTNFIFDTLILFSQAGLRMSSPQEIHNAQIHKPSQQIRDLNLQMIAGFIPCLLATLSHTQSLLPMQRAYNLGRVSMIWSHTRVTSYCVCWKLQPTETTWRAEQLAYLLLDSINVKNPTKLAAQSKLFVTVNSRKKVQLCFHH